MDRLLGPDACVVVLSNVQDAETARILDDISDFLTRHELGIPIGNPAPPTVTPPLAVKVEPAEIEKVLGFYRRSGGATAGAVRGGGGVFLLEFSAGSVIPPVLELVPEGSGSFHLGWRPELKCRFSPDKKDGPLVLTISRGNRILSTANRIGQTKSAFPNTRAITPPSNSKRRSGSRRTSHALSRRNSSGSQTCG
jgi:hypothetical protein